MGAGMPFGGSSASPALAAAVDAAVSELLRTADAWAIACCAANVPLLTEMADTLLAEETLGGPTLDALLARAALPPGYSEWIATGEGTPAMPTTTQAAPPAPASGNGRH
jgi:hypothetical protein